MLKINGEVDHLMTHARSGSIVDWKCSGARILSTMNLREAISG